MALAGADCGFGGAARLEPGTLWDGAAVAAASLAAPHASCGRSPFAPTGPAERLPPARLSAAPGRASPHPRQRRLNAKLGAKWQHRQAQSPSRVWAARGRRPPPAPPPSCAPLGRGAEAAGPRCIASRSCCWCRFCCWSACNICSMPLSQVPAAAPFPFPAALPRVPTPPRPPPPPQPVPPPPPPRPPMTVDDEWWLAMRSAAAATRRSARAAARRRRPPPSPPGAAARRRRRRGAARGAPAGAVPGAPRSPTAGRRRR